MTSDVEALITGDVDRLRAAGLLRAMVALQVPRPQAGPSAHPDTAAHRQRRAKRKAQRAARRRNRR